MFVYKCFDLSVVIFPPLTESATFILIYKKEKKKIHVINFVALELGEK